MSDWDDSDFEGNAPAAAAPATKAAANGSASGAAAAAPVVVPVRGRFADEEDDDDEEVKVGQVCSSGVLDAQKRVPAGWTGGGMQMQDGSSMEALAS